MRWFLILRTTFLLTCANVFMTFAWYAHLKNLADRPWYVAAVASWGIALFEYLLRLWETVRDLTLKSTAPALVYEEGSLIKRSIRCTSRRTGLTCRVRPDLPIREVVSFFRPRSPPSDPLEARRQQ